MVADTGKTLCPYAFKPINLPEAIVVEVSTTDEPAAVRLGLRKTVKSIEDRWRIDDEWWRSEKISRIYYSILLQSGQKLVVFKDMVTGKWWKQG